MPSHLRRMTRSARVALILALMTAVSLLGVARLERGGPSPARSPRQQPVRVTVNDGSSDRPAGNIAPSKRDDSNAGGNNPNRNCKPQGFPGCRPPSGS
jgi:hypothetical protein